MNFMRIVEMIIGGIAVFWILRPAEMANNPGDSENLPTKESPDPLQAYGDRAAMGDENVVVGDDWTDLNEFLETPNEELI